MTVSGIVNRFRMRVRLAKQTTNSTAKGLNMWVNSTIGLAAGFVFVALALCGVLLMLEARRSQSLATKTRLIVLHRISGYNYVILFCFVFYFMSQRLVGIGLSKNLLTAIVTHASLSLLLIPAVIVKVLIARRYKDAHSLLMPLGISIFVISCLLVVTPAFSEFLRNTHPGSIGFRITVGIAIAICVSLCGSKLRSRELVDVFDTPQPQEVMARLKHPAVRTNRVRARLQSCRRASLAKPAASARAKRG